MRLIMGVKATKELFNVSKLELYQEIKRLKRVSLQLRKSRRKLFKENIDYQEEIRRLKRKFEISESDQNLTIHASDNLVSRLDLSDAEIEKLKSAELYPPIRPITEAEAAERFNKKKG